MLNAIIRFSLQQRLLVVGLALFLLGYGTWQMAQLPIDLFPDLNRPRVTIITEAPGKAPEQVEREITIPIETAMNGATGVQHVRSSSGVGISIVWVEFDWGTDMLDDRQIVNERLALATDRLPPAVTPQLAPISSITGQIMIIGVQSKRGETSPMELRTLADWTIRQRLLTIEGVSQVFTMGGERKQFQVLVDPEKLLDVDVTLAEVRKAVEQSNANVTGGYLDDQGAKELLVRVLGRVKSVDDLKKLVVKVQDGQVILLSQVAQVVEGPQVMRGDSAAFVRRRLFEVCVDAEKLKARELTIDAVRQAIRQHDPNATIRGREGLAEEEMLVDSIGRLRSGEDLENVTITGEESGTIRLSEIAQVDEVLGKRLDEYIPDHRDRFAGGPSVLLTVNKQPGADTRQVTADVIEAIRELQKTLPDDVAVHPTLYQQRAFIQLAIDNVREALRDGFLLVVIILFVFLLNVRTTLITLMAIPLSVVVTAFVFAGFGLSINTMTLGGLAVAIGELVDDAIVDVENIFRRLRENRLKKEPRPVLSVVYRASVEIRNSIVFGTLIVVLFFVPPLGLSGMEGRMFRPLAIAYIISIVSSLAVSLTVTPVLCSWLLPNAGSVRSGREGPLLRALKWVAAWPIRFGVAHNRLVLAGAAVMLAVAVGTFTRLQRDFLPPFDEGVVQLNLIMDPGTSLARSRFVAQQAERCLQEIDGLETFLCKTGRAELDEHAVGVNVTEVIATFRPDSGRSREETLAEIREAIKGIEGVVASVEQPLAHLISHMLSGVQAQVAVKIYSDDLDDLDVLRTNAEKMRQAIVGIDGVEDLIVERQIRIDQLRITLDRDRLALHGLTPVEVSDLVETAMQGKIDSQVVIGQQTYDLLVRFDDRYRENINSLKRLRVDLPDGGTIPLDSVAQIKRAQGPNTINREKVLRRIVLQCNVTDRGLVDVVNDIRAAVAPIQAELPEGCFVEFGGQFESEEEASRTMIILFSIPIIGTFLVLYTMFRSANFALQVMAAALMAFVGGVAALVITGQMLTIAAWVGFISLGGIASRNGILLLNHYLHLVRVEGESFSPQMLVRAGQERLAPVLMTALTTGIGLVPLAMAAGEPGKEILYPIATVIIGGLISSTALEFLVRPALFWSFGREAGRKLADRQHDVEWD